MSINPTKAAQRGAQLLDDLRPGWASLMELQSFDITTPCECVIGQVFQPEVGWDRVHELLGLNNHWQLPDYGFEPDPEAEHDYDRLEDAWTTEIKARLQP